jgi:hypothetical protein
MKKNITEKKKSPTPKELLIKLKDIIESELKVRQKHLDELDTRIQSLIPEVHGPLPTPPPLKRYNNPSTFFENRTKYNFFKNALNKEENQSNNRGEIMNYDEAYRWVEKLYKKHLLDIERDRQRTATLKRKVLNSLRLNATYPKSAYRKSPYRISTSKKLGKPSKF